jgi:hypothetical protein
VKTGTAARSVMRRDLSKAGLVLPVNGAQRLLALHLVDAHYDRCRPPALTPRDRAWLRALRGPQCFDPNTTLDTKDSLLVKAACGEATDLWRLHQESASAARADA